MKVTSRGFVIHYEDRGSGPPLVLIPGLAQSTTRWIDEGYVEEFSADYRVIAVDPLGHGLSDKPHDPEVYRREDCARDVLAVLDAIDEPDAHFWGYSRGSALALSIATIARERVCSLVIGGHSPFPPRADALPGQRQLYLRFATLLEAEGWDAFWDAFGADPATRERLQLGNDPLALAAVWRAHASGSVSWRLDQLPRAPLVYGGSEERWVPEALAAASAAGVEIHVLAGRDHASAFTDRGAVAPLVRAYLAREVSVPPQDTTRRNACETLPA